MPPGRKAGGLSLGGATRETHADFPKSFEASPGPPAYGSQPMTRVLHVLLGLLLLLPATSEARGQCGQPADCLSPHPTPGCSDLDCCSTVCVTDPLCCSLDWDAGCVGLANSLCVGLCGAAASGDCVVPHPTPACNRRDCCESVCVIDPFCCDVAWDFTCALRASLQCPPDEPGTCGDPEAGSCTQPHSSPACEDQACCEFVCDVDPTCCSQAWDTVCVALASQLCVGGCEPECPAGAVLEDEDCGQDVNNPCYATPSPFPSIQSIACGSWACGQITSTPGGFRDIDTWGVTIVDADGNGQVPVRLEFASSFDGFAALVPAPCGGIAGAAVKIETDFCVELASAVTCVPPGEYRIVVAAGSFPVPANPDLTCGQFGETRYRVRLECLPVGCGPVCGPGAGSCFEPRKQPGCEDATCCDAVCATDPPCCDAQWDSGCVQSAQSLCADPPVNDECTGAVYVPVDDPTAISNIGATSGLPGFPAACGGLQVGADIWFRFVAPRTAACTVTTCGSGTFDTVLAVMSACGGKPIACNDDGAQCIPDSSSRLTFAATCGSEYLIRVGSVGSVPGTAILKVLLDVGPGCGCPADLDGDGSVGPSDLTDVLSSWGGPGGDLDGDGTTGPADLTELLSSWGPCP